MRIPRIEAPLTGNGMFKSLGNIRVNPSVGLLFIAMNDRVTPTDIFPNCPRYIPDLPSGAPSPYIPCAGVPPQEPAWKGFDDFKDVVPPRRA